VIFIFQFIEII